MASVYRWGIGFMIACEGGEFRCVRCFGCCVFVSHNVTFVREMTLLVVWHEGTGRSTNGTFCENRLHLDNLVISSLRYQWHKKRGESHEKVGIFKRVCSHRSNPQFRKSNKREVSSTFLRHLASRIILDHERRAHD